MKSKKLSKKTDTYIGRVYRTTEPKHKVKFIEFKVAEKDYNYEDKYILHPILANEEYKTKTFATCDTGYLLSGYVKDITEEYFIRQSVREVIEGE